MSRASISLILFALISAIGLCHGRVLPPAPVNEVMLAGISSDKSMFIGGISNSLPIHRGTITVEPIARLTESGEWKSLPCQAEDTANCRKFEREYLSKSHDYTVISSNGRGAIIHAAPTTLDECYCYSGTGTYSGSVISGSAIAASSVDFFAESIPPQEIDAKQTGTVRKALAALVPSQLDSTQHLRVFTLNLEGKQVFAIQRAFTDIASIGTDNRFKLIFAIGRIMQSRFQVLHWKENTDDEEERILGTISLKNGRAFLLTTVNDPEGQWFRVYGIKNGHLTLIYSGGGSSC